MLYISTVCAHTEESLFCIFMCVGVLVCVREHWHLPPVPLHLYIQVKPLAQCSAPAFSRIPCVHLLHWDHKTDTKSTYRLLMKVLRKRTSVPMLYLLFYFLCSQVNKQTLKHGPFPFNSYLLLTEKQLF